MIIRRRLLSVLVISLGTFFLAPAAASAACSYTIPKATILEAVQPDASVQVTEQLTFDFDNECHGAWRDIRLPIGATLDKTTLSNGQTVFTSGANTALRVDDTPNSFGVTTIAGDGQHTVYRIVWHYQLSGQQTFQLQYRLTHVVNVYTDVADVYTQLWGDNWDVGVGTINGFLTPPTVQASLTPTGKLQATGKISPTDPTYRVWAHPRQVEATIVRSEQGAVLVAKNVVPHEFVEARMTFDRNMLSSAAAGNKINAAGLPKIVASEQAEQHIFQQQKWKVDVEKHPIAYAMIIIFFALAVVWLPLIGLYWWFMGRDKRPQDVPEYVQEPPDSTSPAIAAQLVQQGDTTVTANDGTWVATLFDLVQRKYLVLEPVAGSTEQDGQLSLGTNTDTKALHPHEQIVFTTVQEAIGHQGGQTVNLSAFPGVFKLHRQHYAQRFTDYVDCANREISEGAWYRRQGRGRRTIGVILLFFALGGVAYAVLSAQHSLADGTYVNVWPLIIGAALLPLGLLLIVLPTSVWAQYNKTVLTQAAQWQAFRHWLHDFPDLEEAPPISIVLWERLLVFGIAFGEAERVLEAAHKFVQAPTLMASPLYATTYDPMGHSWHTPDWYDHDWNNNLQSATTPPPAPSSGDLGGGGGGISFGGGGGGFGGGGGGAW